MPKLDFSGLSDTAFEEFTFHLLGCLGFVNVDWRKGTAHDSSPADSGRDIVAQQIREDVDKTKSIETWFVECKPGVESRRNTARRNYAPTTKTILSGVC